MARKWLTTEVEWQINQKEPILIQVIFSKTSAPVRESPSKLKALQETIIRMNEKNTRLTSENRTLKQDLEKMMEKDAKSKDVQSKNHLTKIHLTCSLLYTLISYIFHLRIILLW